MAGAPTGATARRLRLPSEGYRDVQPRLSFNASFVFFDPSEARPGGCRVPRVEAARNALHGKAMETARADPPCLSRLRRALPH